jgi:hypothetical protein
MTLPVGMTYRTVVGKLTDVEPGAVRAICFASPGWLFGDEIVAPFAVELAFAIDSDGTFSIELPSTDDPAYVPQPWLYRVKITGGSNVQRGTLAVPHVGTGDIDLATSLQLPGAAVAGAVYLLANARGVAGGVAGLDADGDVVDAAGTKITGGEGGATSWSSITGKPTSFAPSGHGLSHADGGSDEIVLDASQIGTGTIAIGRLPVGAGASQVAAGTHTHEGGGGGTEIVVVREVERGGNTTPVTNAAWTFLSGAPTLSIAAAVGDYVEFSILSMLFNPGNGYYDLAVIVGGSPVRYFATDTATPGAEGCPAFYPQPSSFRTYGPTFEFEVEAGDLSGGTVTVGWVNKGNGTGVVYADNTYPLKWRAMNYGPVL